MLSYNQIQRLKMENGNWADLIFGGVALLIVISGLFLLFQGIGAMNKKD